MTTVGYGDKAPRTPLGRTLAFIWMFAAIVLISGLTAAITSTLTVSQLGSPVKGPEDLSSVRVAAVEGTSSTLYFRAHGVPYRSVPSLEDALQLLADGDVDCVVHDVPLLRYMIRTEFPGKAIVLPAVFDRQQYAVVMSPHSPYRERINVAILEQIQSDWWDATLQRYLGD
jgi:ABC-type amino acid transport substrate-binding protein